MARLQGEDGLSVEVAVSLLVADSRLVRAVLVSHEGQERLVTLARVEGDILRHYAQIRSSALGGRRSGTQRS